jgi:DNA-directed RNA polymerase subunit omega
MNVVNSDVEAGDEPVVNSRYSIVMATSKRARQIIAGDEPLIADTAGKKPFSIAVEELYKGEVKILGDGEDEGEEAEVEDVPVAEEQIAEVPIEE